MKTLVHAGIFCDVTHLIFRSLRDIFAGLDIVNSHIRSRGKCSEKKTQLQIEYPQRELRDKEGQWIYKQGTLAPGGLNENHGFYGQYVNARANLTLLMSRVVYWRCCVFDYLKTCMVNGCHSP